MKVKEVKNLINLNNKDPKFRNWYASTITLLKNLPPVYFKEVNSFKKLAFSDTRYHRTKKPFNSLDENKYTQDLKTAEEILKTIVNKIAKSSKNDNKRKKETL
ncbi:MAG: hypothetical protein H5T85_07465 [Actinobacteria bacterium]|nr:hypothetical protein [Actinomycetota bacterium]